MAHLHCQRRSRVQTRIRIATLYYAEHVHIAQIQTWIPTSYFCTGQESESKSVSSNVNKSLHHVFCIAEVRDQ